MTNVGRQTEETHVRSADHKGEFNRHTLRLFSTSSTDGASAGLLCLAKDYTSVQRNHRETGAEYSRLGKYKAKTGQLVDGRSHAADPPPRLGRWIRRI